MRAWERTKLRTTAVRYAEHGWHVTPGAFLVGRGLLNAAGRRLSRTFGRRLADSLGKHARERRFDCGAPGCRTIACHPVLPDWERRASTDPAVVAGWWRTDPYSVLLPTGHAFDVLEVPALLGRAALLGDGFVAARGPLAITPDNRWMFLVRPGHGVLPELAGLHDVVLHGQGSWIPAPPSPGPDGRLRWEVTPEQHDWRPAEPYVIQALMLDAIGAGPPARTTRPSWHAVGRAA